MPLRKSPKKTTGLLAANRHNAKKSTGPRTTLGKARVARNSYIHGSYAAPDKQTREEMERLGDDLALLARLERALARSWQPANEMQSLIVADLAKLYWKKVHLERTVIANRLAEMRRVGAAIDEHNLNANADATPIDAMILSAAGYREILDSQEAFDESLRLLDRLAELVEQGDWQADFMAMITMLYGEQPARRGKDMANILAVLAAPDGEIGAEEEDAACAELKSLIAGEKLTVEAQQQYFQRQQKEDFRATIGSNWVPTTVNWSQVLSEDARLDRLIENKIKLLIRLKGLRTARPAEKDGDSETMEHEKMPGVAGD